MTTNNGQNDNKDFKGKVMYYSNINGQEKRVEKEFDSQDAMNTYMHDNDMSFSRPSYQPFWLGNWWGFNSWIDTFFDNKLTSMWYTPSTSQSSLSYDDSFDALKRQKLALEKEERNKEKQKSFLEKRLQDWKDLKDFFNKKWHKEEVEKAEKGIKDCEEKLKEYT